MSESKGMKMLNSYFFRAWDESRSPSEQARYRFARADLLRILGGMDNATPLHTWIRIYKAAHETLDVCFS